MTLAFTVFLRKHMLPIVPSEVVTGSWELICCLFTSVAAVLSYMFVRY
jgi:hypothetical protein